MPAALQQFWKRLTGLCARVRVARKSRLSQSGLAQVSGRTEMARDRVRIWLSQTPFQP